MDALDWSYLTASKTMVNTVNMVNQLALHCFHFIPTFTKEHKWTNQNQIPQLDKYVFHIAMCRGCSRDLYCRGATAQNIMVNRGWCKQEGRPEGLHMFQLVSSPGLLPIWFELSNARNYTPTKE